jgi:hypothetical protein
VNDEVVTFCSNFLSSFVVVCGGSWLCASCSAALYLFASNLLYVDIARSFFLLVGLFIASG